MPGIAVTERLGVALEAFRGKIWPLPTLGLLLAVGLGVALPELDARVDDDLPAEMSRYLFSGGPDAARSILSAIAGSLVTLTSLTFSLTVVTLQLASSQFSPRLLRTFSSDRFVHVTLALFVSTFVYSLTVLRTVRTQVNASPGFVPQVSVTVAMLLALASVLGLVLFLSHLAGEIRVETMLRRVHRQAEDTAERTLDERDGVGTEVVLPEPPSGAVPIVAPSSGFLTAVDSARLLRLAVDTGSVLLLERPPGSSVVAGTPIGWRWPSETDPTGGAGEGRHGGDGESVSARLGEALTIAHEPTASQDVSFGLKQITDVASKALSPGINDPRTAVRALGHSSALLCGFSRLSLGPDVLTDEQGAARVFRFRQDFADLLDLSVSAPRRYGAADPDVLARLYALLAEVAWTISLPRHNEAVERQRRRLDTTAEQQDFDDVERGRLTELSQQVTAAIDGRHDSPATPVVS